MRIWTAITGLVCGCSQRRVTLTNVAATNNGYEGGIHLDNMYCYYDNVVLNQWGCPTPSAVTMINLDIGSNGGTGLFVDSLGAIRLTGANANSNSGPGIDMANAQYIYDDIHINDWVYPATFNGITMSNINVSDNQGAGLEVYSRGLISLTSGWAQGNWNFGFNLNNRDYQDAIAGITLSGVQAYNNGNTGILARTNGALTMSNLRATGNVKTGGGIGLDEFGNGMSVQDFYNENFGPDHWYFEADPGQDYKFTLRADSQDYLNRIAFDPWIELYYVNYETGEKTQLDLTDPVKMHTVLQCVTNDYCEFTFDPGDFGYSGTENFFVMLGSKVMYGDGFYRLSMNDPDTDTIEDMFWVNGLGFEAGSTVTLTGSIPSRTTR